MSVSLSSILRGRVGRAVYDFDQYWAYHLTPGTTTRAPDALRRQRHPDGRLSITPEEPHPFTHSIVDDEEAERVDRVFAALGDATQRDILRRAALGEHSVSALEHGHMLLH